MAPSTPAPKKGRNWLLILGGIFLAFVICGIVGQLFNRTPEGQSFSATRTAEAIAAATEEAKPTNTPVPAPPTPTPNPAAAYRAFFTDTMGNLSAAMTEFGDLNNRAGQDPSLFTDQSWILNVAAQTVIIEEESQRLIDYPLNNVPLSVLEAHAKFVEAATLLRDSMPIYREGVDTRNPELITTASEMAQEANNLISEATALLP